ncbi:hypothetical protein GDO86_008862 [Hymenochirus boettgeri]|uniref:Pseudouridine synthase II N-terminal domain-containing protein n=1 Tax=Hymenochirus boettgeri TaxID=247094 RepID=A0A8T2J3V2_9PIPI|nr:hypothetical protein GDO86_008862 [Hymenochirus boettgeri]
MVRFASHVLRTLHGVFAVYKPPGVHWKLVRDTVETNLLKVKGPAYRHLRVGAGHRLDTGSSGVFVLGICNGNKLLTEMYNGHLTRDYTVRGTFGKATDNFLEFGKVIEKTTYDHITRDKLERILAVIQGSGQKALILHSHVDLKCQEAYELAVKGELRPMDKSPPIILGIRCLEFSPPDFTLEIQCMHETQQYLRKMIHEIGLELRSTAVCTQVRRTRDGPFTVDQALLRNQWNLKHICKAVTDCRALTKDLIKDKPFTRQVNLDTKELSREPNSVSEVEELRA